MVTFLCPSFLLVASEISQQTQDRQAKLYVCMCVSARDRRVEIQLGAGHIKTETPPSARCKTRQVNGGLEFKWLDVGAWRGLLRSSSAAGVEKSGTFGKLGNWDLGWLHGRVPKPPTVVVDSTPFLICGEGDRYYG